MYHLFAVLYQHNSMNICMNFPQYYNFYIIVSCIQPEDAGILNREDNKLTYTPENLQLELRKQAPATIQKVSHYYLL